MVRNVAWIRHVAALASYTVLSIAATWPLARNFDSRLIGDAHQDQMHSVWILWHTNEWLHGREHSSRPTSSTTPRASRSSPTGSA